MPAIGSHNRRAASGHWPGELWSMARMPAALSSIVIVMPWTLNIDVTARSTL